MTATPIFRDRGLAALRRTEDGSLFLDKGLVPKKAKGVRIRVKEGDHLVGCSKVCRPSQDADSIESRILQARDTVFEEELFHEIVREARILGTQGVKARPNLVQVPLPDAQEMLLDLVDWDQDHRPDQTTNSELDVLADTTAHCIRILLTHAHRQNLRRRTQPPPPVAPKRRPAPEYQILRPIMAFLQHKSHTQWLESVIGDLSRVLQAAGIECDLKTTKFSSIGTLQPNNIIEKVEALARVFLFPFESTFTLVTPQSSSRVHIRTNPVAPPFGTHYDLAIKLPQFQDVRPPSRVGLQEEVSAILTHILLLDLISAISRSQPPKGQSPWEISRPHHGELVASGSYGQKKTMKVSLSREELAINIYTSQDEGLGELTAKSPTMSQTWRPETAKPTLFQFVTEAPQSS